MEDVLEGLNETPGVQGSLVVGKDGLVIAFAGVVEPDPDTIGATTAELLNSMEAGLAERAPIDMVSVEGGQGNLFLSTINEVTYLLVLTQDDINLGRVRYDIRNSCSRLRDQL